jgi:hypothetical protein
MCLPFNGVIALTLLLQTAWCEGSDCAFDEHQCWCLGIGVFEILRRQLATGALLTKKGIGEIRPAADEFSRGLTNRSFRASAA